MSRNWSHLQKISNTALLEFTINADYLWIHTSEMYRALAATLRGCPNLRKLSIQTGNARCRCFDESDAEELCAAIGDSPSLLELTLW